MARGLLEDNHEWRICLKKAIAIQSRMVCCWYKRTLPISSLTPDQPPRATLQYIKYYYVIFDYFQLASETPDPNNQDCRDRDASVTGCIYSIEYPSKSLILISEDSSGDKCNLYFWTVIQLRILLESYSTPVTLIVDQDLLSRVLSKYNRAVHCVCSRLHITLLLKYVGTSGEPLESIQCPELSPTPSTGAYQKTECFRK